MARTRKDQKFLPSLLDRLLDDHPDAKTDPATSPQQQLSDLKRSVKRDLENLLNTRYRCREWPPNLDQLEASLVNYGLPDFTGVNVEAESREDLRRIVEEVLKRFEPRFKTVRVLFLENADETDRTLRFRIDALLHANPAPERVVFDSQLEPVSGNFNVKTSDE